MEEELKKKILEFQKNELTEYFTYRKLSERVKNPRNKEVLQRIAEDENKHYDFWKQYTKKDVKLNRVKMWKYVLTSRLFGLTFGIRLMERGEVRAQKEYGKIIKAIPAAKNVIKDENEHEKQLISFLDPEGLKYIGSVVLGLNDALVELTGALAGFTLALQNTHLIAIIGSITGIAAAMSMAASEYLSTKTEENKKSPLRASVYTGITYILTVMLLIAPFLIFHNIYLCLGVTILNAIIVIFAFNFYISVAKDIPFRKRFLEMAAISLGIAALSFAIAFLIRKFFSIEV